MPGPYNHYFDKQIGVEKFLELFKNEKNRKARLEHCFAYCEPGEEPVVFTGGGTGTISFEEEVLEEDGMINFIYLMERQKL